MQLIEDIKALQDLKSCIEENIAKLDLSKKIKKTNIDKNSPQKEPRQHQKEHAAITIQRTWRNYKVKQAIIKNSYFAYLSLMDPDDEHRLLSNVMFGRHVAEVNASSKHRINNPYIDQNAFYHRDDTLSSLLLDKLLQALKVKFEEKDSFTFIPVTLLKGTPIAEICKNFFPDAPIKIISNKDHSVGLIALANDYYHNDYYHYELINQILRSAGLVASPWEIAINIQIDKDAVPQQIILNYRLPKTSQELIESSIYNKLSFISKDPHKSTQKLAVCLQKILKNLPVNTKLEAIQRIACIVDLANTFYAHDYPKFAFSVYTTIHEISLSILEQQGTENLEQGFNDFLIESQHTLDKALSIDSAAVNKAMFIAYPAMSGTNAYMLAIQLALKMKTSSENPPLIKVFEPSYFEFEYITKTSSSADADIFVLSAGPIVNPEGLTPGIDINRFVKSNIIAANRKRPAALIVDTTTALYKNMHLDPEVQKLINEGSLSLIIHESHQKFGMIHTDQAQYGRMLAICSKEQFDINIIIEMQENAKEDYANHLDLRVGSYISSTCGDTLEQIKEQHFSNGALLRNILIQTSLASKQVVKHEHMLSNLNELYFVTSTQAELSNASRGVIEKRDSFGHFGTTSTKILNQIRLSPDASDDLDCLIQTAQIYLAHHFKPRDVFKLLITSAKHANNFFISEQIIITALANNILNDLFKITVSETFSLLFTLDNLLKKCDGLKGRQYYNTIAKSYFELRQEIINTYHVKNQSDFFAAAKILNDRNISLNSKQLHQLSNSDLLTRTISKHSHRLSKSILAIVDLAGIELSSTQIQLMLNNKKFLFSVEKIYSAIKEILLNLKNDSKKHQKAIKYSKCYFIDCFNALENFYNKPINNENNKKILIEGLKLAKENYLRDVLGVDRSASSQAIRYRLKVIVNFVAAFTFGSAHYINYKVTGHALFFAHTKSKDKIRKNSPRNKKLNKR